MSDSRWNFEEYKRQRDGENSGNSVNLAVLEGLEVPETSEVAERPETSQNLSEFGGWSEIIQNFQNTEAYLSQLTTVKNTILNQEFFDLFLDSDAAEITTVKTKIQKWMQEKWEILEEFQLRRVVFNLELIDDHVQFLTDYDATENPEEEDVKKAAEIIKQKALNELINIRFRISENFPNLADLDTKKIDNQLAEILRKFESETDNFELYKDQNPVFLKYLAITGNLKKSIIALNSNIAEVQVAQFVFSENSKNRLEKIEEVRGLIRVQMNQNQNQNPEDPQDHQEFLNLKLFEKILKLDLLESHKDIDNLLIKQIDLLTEKEKVDLLIFQNFPSRPSNEPQAVIYDNLIQEFRRNLFENL